MNREITIFRAVILGLTLAGAQPSHAQVDAEAAQALARKNDCFKCHAIDKVKKGPTYRRVAARLKAKPDAVEIIVEHITTGPLIQMEDGSYEKHRIMDTQDPNELKNFALWILSL